MTTVAVIAKECLPGRVKTRLTPPFSPEQAARLAAASLDDTLDTVRALPVERRILFFDGDAAPPAAIGFDLLRQPSGGLDDRLAALFDAVDGPLLLVGMDTPQLAHGDLSAFWHELASGVADAWFGPARDGGFWALGMREPDGSLIRGVPMSRDDTGSLQRARLVDAGLTVSDLRELRDVDTVDDAEAVAADLHGSRFAAALAGIRTGDRTGVRSGARA